MLHQKSVCPWPLFLSVLILLSKCLSVKSAERFFRMQMFLWNNIFLSLGFDVKDHFKDFGGDAAAYVAPVSVLHVYFCAFI